MEYEEKAVNAMRERTAASHFPDPGWDVINDLLVLTGALENVLLVHRTVPYGIGRQRVTCFSCGGAFPCPTRQAIRDELRTLRDPSNFPTFPSEVPVYLEGGSGRGGRL